MLQGKAIWQLWRIAQVLGVSPEEEGTERSRELYEGVLRAFPPGAVSEASLREVFARMRRAKGAPARNKPGGASRSISAEPAEQQHEPAAVAAQHSQPPRQEPQALAAAAASNQVPAVAQAAPAAALPKAEQPGGQPVGQVPEQAAAEAGAGAAAEPMCKDDDATAMKRLERIIEQAVAQGGDLKAMTESVLHCKRGTVKAILNTVSLPACLQCPWQLH